MKTLDEILEKIYNNYQDDTGLVSDGKNIILLAILYKAKQEILDWVSAEIIGDDEPITLELNGSSQATIHDRNFLRLEQRQKLQKLKENL